MAAKTVNAVCKIIITLFGVCSLVLLLYALFGNAAGTGLLSRVGAGGTLFLTLTAAVMLLTLIIVAFGQIGKMGERSLRIFTAVLFLAILAVFAVMLANFRVIPITDSHAMLDEAKYLADHPGAVVDSSSPHHVYFAKYSNNYFLTICFMYFFRLLTRIGVSDLYFSLYLLNAALLYIGMVFAYLAAKEAGGRSCAVRTLLLLALNPIFYVLTFWVYSCTISVPLMTAIIWLGIRIYKSKTAAAAVIQAVFAAILGVLSCLIRPTSLIPLIALAVLAVLLCIKGRHIRRTAAVCAVCLVILPVLLTALNQAAAPYFDTLSDGNYPVTHWLMMGSHGSGTYNSADDRFTASFDTKEEKQEATLEKLKEHYRTLGISGTLVLYLKKMCITFADGWSECDVRLAQDTKFTPLYTLLAGDLRDLFRIYCNAFRIVTLFLMTAAAVISLRKKYASPYLLLYMLTMLGGILFYFLWEAKSTYSVPFIPVMLLAAETGGCAVLEQTRKGVERRGAKTVLRLGAAAGIVWVFAGAVFYYAFCSEETAHTRYSVRGYSLQLSGYVEGMETEGDAFAQTFYADRPFNRIDLYVDSTKETGSAAEYELKILDSASDVLFETVFFADQVKNNKVTITLPRIEGGRSEQYCLMVTKRSDDFPALLFRHRYSLSLDQYDGELFVNGKASDCDILMSVYDSYSASYMSSRQCALLYLTGTAAAIILYICMFRFFLPDFCRQFRKNKVK